MATENFDNIQETLRRLTAEINSSIIGSNQYNRLVAEKQGLIESTYDNLDTLRRTPSSNPPKSFVQPSVPDNPFAGV